MCGAGGGAGRSGRGAEEARAALRDVRYRNDGKNRERVPPLPGNQCVDGLGARGSDLLGDVASEMDPAPLPPKSGQDRFDRGFQVSVRVTGDQGDAG